MHEKLALHETPAYFTVWHTKNMNIYKKRAFFACINNKEFSVHKKELISKSETVQVFISDSIFGWKFQIKNIQWENSLHTLYYKTWFCCTFKVNCWFWYPRHVLLNSVVNQSAGVKMSPESFSQKVLLTIIRQFNWNDSDFAEILISKRKTDKLTISNNSKDIN